ncbi:zinc finger CCHC domain-containing protein 3-like [Trichomycterus rosablanca]|uniref:zinc finger CCHC domain-containing protein 3-like n=1 Tax=Trichomycterus rosablanca TaxID=2290929 RepID=UPI002F35D619
MASSMSFRESYNNRFLKYWAKISFIGSGSAPSRDEVAEKLFMSQSVSGEDIFSFISLPNRKDFELCFRNERSLRVFMNIYNSNKEQWRDFEIFSPLQFDIKTVIVKFWTGRIPDEDVELYLRRFCDIVKPAIKPVDRFGIWYGIRKYQVRIKKDLNNQDIGIPNNISLGPYNGKIIYQGQISRCYTCQATDHIAKECKEVKCWQCSSFGHKAKDCNNTAICNLCGTVGYTFFMCPNSYANRSKTSFGTEVKENLFESVQPLSTTEAGEKNIPPEANSSNEPELSQTKDKQQNEMDQTESLFISTTLEENGTVTECKNVEDLKQTGNNDSSETSSTEDSSSGSSSSDDSSTTESGEESTKGSASESCNIALEISLISNEGTEDIRQDNTSASKELKEKRNSSLNPHVRKEELHRNKKGRSMEHTRYILYLSYIHIQMYSTMHRNKDF